MGKFDLQPAKSEIKIREQWRLGLVWEKDINSNSIISNEDIAIRKPATGLRPKDLNKIIGSKTKKNCKKGESVLISDLQK